jgi:molybdopterin-guanine dinucleotide biosynthesis protein A
VVVQAEEVIGYVVAGGRSVRMGRDKALLPWQAVTLLDHALARLRSVCGDVRVLCGPTRRYAERGAPLVLDRVADAGPLAALEAALADAAGRPILFLGVDLPFVTTAVLDRLRSELAGADAAVPVVAERAEPLCAAYGPRCLAPVRTRLDAGERRMTCFWPDVRVREVAAAELYGGDAAALFRNLNTPHDFTGATGPARDNGPERP